MIEDNMDFVEIFEKKLCDYTGFKYAVCVDCCTNAILLSLEVKKILNEIDKQKDIIELTKYTYMSVPMTLKNYNWKIKLIDDKWKCFYKVGLSTNVYDAATDLHENMVNDYNNALVCVSFQQKKRLSLGRGGVILFNEKKYYDLLKRLRYDGRNPKLQDKIEIANFSKDILIGYHFYMEPEKAAKGILILNQKQLLPAYKKYSWKNYCDLSNLDILK